MTAEQFSGDARAFAAEPGGDASALPDLPHGQPRAGPVRDRRPVYVDLMRPCNAGCHEQAWRQLIADNPFAAIHGRVCYHPFESVCNRAHLDGSALIHAEERFQANSGAHGNY
jgi:NADPH-dependent glutamate synthase beta subunit-like oxidoreductase